MSRLLLDEPPVVVQPSLVRRLGLLEAAIVQQLHYWSGRATRSHEGHTYVYKTYGDWSQEIGVTAKQARGALDRLRKDGVVIAIQNPTNDLDRTLWWRVDYAVIDGSGSPSAPQGRSDAPGGAPSAPAGTSTRASGSSSETTSETTSKDARSRAPKKSDNLPDDFPEHLKPHARRVFAILRDIAEQHNAREVTPRGIGLAIQGHPGRRFVGVAYELASWAQTPTRPIRDVVGTYRTFLDRAPTYAGVEQFDTPPVGVAASAGNVHTFPAGGRGPSRYEKAQAGLAALHAQYLAEDGA